ncbi:hypothetical protein D3C75_756000 [compost metagenome]
MTFKPRSRKYSAIVVAMSAPLMRISAGWSEVATTTTERCSPSGPRSRSMKSSTSLPRSPIKAITFTSAEVLRAIMPIRVLLPTPDPAKIPTRWPLPIVSKPSIALTPILIGSCTLGRFSGLDGMLNVELCGIRAGMSEPSSGCPSPSRTLPSSSEPTCTLRGLPVPTTSQPGPMACSSPNGISSTLLSRKPTTSACSGLLPLDG